MTIIYVHDGEVVSVASKTEEKFIVVNNKRILGARIQVITADNEFDRGDIKELVHEIKTTRIERLESLLAQLLGDSTAKLES